MRPAECYSTFRGAHTFNGIHALNGPRTCVNVPGDRAGAVAPCAYFVACTTETPEPRSNDSKMGANDCLRDAAHRARCGGRTLPPGCPIGALNFEPNPY